MRSGQRGLALLGASAAISGVFAGGATSAAGDLHARRPVAQTSGAVDARVVGTFKMRAVVTTAVNVSGEHAGQRFTRIWAIVPHQCQESVCQVLSLNRQRSANRHDHVMLSRTGRGRYAGNGVFYVALSCNGHTYRRASRVPFRITLEIRGLTAVQGIRFARRLHATYTNQSRTDSTPCRLGPSHDAGRYTGQAISPVPGPPEAAFSETVDASTDTGRFTGKSHPGAGGAKIVSRRWRFGDPRSGPRNHASGRSVTHHFSAPGTYGVSFTVIDANGLSSTSAASVVAPGAPTASFTHRKVNSSGTFSFQDRSTSGYGGAAVVAWKWTFGDPNSGAQNVSRVQNPSHTFSAPGGYTVTLKVTDADGLTSTTSRQLRYR